MRRDSWYLQKQEIKSFALGLIINISPKESMVYTNDCRDIVNKLTSGSLLDNIRKQPGGNRCGGGLLWQKNNSITWKNIFKVCGLMKFIKHSFGDYQTITIQAAVCSVSRQSPSNNDRRRGCLRRRPLGSFSQVPQTRTLRQQQDCQPRGVAFCSWQLQSGRRSQKQS